MSSFVKSIIVWLSDFPNSPVSIHDTMEHFATPKIFYGLLDILLGSNDAGTFSNHFDRNAHLHEILEKHLETKAATAIVTEIKELVSLINFNLLFERDLQTCVQACVLLYLVGTHTSNYSNLGITSLGFLNEDDRSTIETYMAIYRKDRLVLSVLRDFDDFERTLADEQRHSFSALKAKAEVIFSKYQLESSAKMPSSSTSSTLERQKQGDTASTSSAYVDEDYIDSLVWENKLLEGVIYKLVM